MMMAKTMRPTGLHLFWAFTFLTAPAFADGGGAADLLNQTKLPAHLTDPSPNSVRVTTSCTDANGLIYRSTDEGYENCLRSMRAKPTSAAPKPSADGKVPAPGATPSLNFQYGS